jgi:hypothetical protein
MKERAGSLWRAEALLHASISEPQAGLSKGVALPVIENGRCRAVIALED